MDAELLAKEMRERALLIGDSEDYQLKLKTRREVEKEKAKRRARLEELKKLYFNAGRWAGGARDHAAREAFQRVNEHELRA